METKTSITVDGLKEVASAIGVGIAWAGFWIGLGIAAAAFISSGLVYNFTG